MILSVYRVDLFAEQRHLKFHCYFFYKLSFCYLKSYLRKLKFRIYLKLFTKLYLKFQIYVFKVFKSKIIVSGAVSQPVVTSCQSVKVNYKLENISQARPAKAKHAKQLRTRLNSELFISYDIL